MAGQTRAYRAAIIGHTGRGNYGHGLDTCFSGLPNVEVVAVADPDQAGRAAAQDRSGATSSYPDYRRMLEHERPDLVAIARRMVAERLEMVTAAAEAGCHLYVEKPLAATLAEADEMLAICRQYGVRMAVAHQLRLLPSVLYLQRLLTEGRIGRVRQVRGTGKMDHRGGYEEFFIIAPHYLDLMRLYAGDAHWCSADLLTGSRLATDSDAREGVDEIGPVLGDGLFATYGFDHDIIGAYEVFRDLGAETRAGLVRHRCGGGGWPADDARRLRQAALLPPPSVSGARRHQPPLGAGRAAARARGRVVISRHRQHAPAASQSPAGTGPDRRD